MFPVSSPRPVLFKPNLFSLNNGSHSYNLRMEVMGRQRTRAGSGNVGDKDTVLVFGHQESGLYTPKINDDLL